MPLTGRSRVGENRCHTGYTGHFSLIGTYLRLRHVLGSSERVRALRRQARVQRALGR